VVVNNAGYSLSGDTESVTEQEMHDQLETNFFGLVRVTLRALKTMRESGGRGGRGGLIMNISSLAGVCSFPGQAFYHASKWAVEGWTESVAREVHPDWNSMSCRSPSSLGKLDANGCRLQSTSASSSRALLRRTLKRRARSASLVTPPTRILRCPRACSRRLSSRVWLRAALSRPPTSLRCSKTSLAAERRSRSTCLLAPPPRG
jgi:NAD(P)-dependent dehydrogenase (short-subunit alcohol dehydrogenase family)